MQQLKRIAGIIIVLLVLAGIAFGSIYSTRWQSLSTLEKLTDYKDGYNLYSMRVKYDYDLDKVINSGYTDTQGMVEAVVKEALPLLPVSIKVPAFGCSAFRTKTVDGRELMGRNYDFKLDTSALMVLCEPKNGYKSLAFAALNNVNADKAETGLASKLACLTAPFICLDGVNEKGVSVAVLTLPSKPTMHNTGKPKLGTPLLIRLVLDRAASTEEALQLIKQYDILSANGRDYHFVINDASGNCVAVEFDCEDKERKLVVTPTPAITNFFIMYSHKVKPSQANGIYGKGKERYNAMLEVLARNAGRLDRETAWEALRAASQAPNPADITSNTQWSVVYDNTKGTAEISLRRRWQDRFAFSIGK